MHRICAMSLLHMLAESLACMDKKVEPLYLCITCVMCVDYVCACLGAFVHVCIRRMLEAHVRAHVPCACVSACAHLLPNLYDKSVCKSMISPMKLRDLPLPLPPTSSGKLSTKKLPLMIDSNF